MQHAFAMHQITHESNGIFMLRGPNTPHRHVFQQVFIITKGGGTHYIDGETHEVVPPWGMLVAMGKVHLFTPHVDAEGWCIDFKEEFLPLETTWLFSPFFELSNVALGEGLLLDQCATLARLLLATSQAEGGMDNPALPHLLAALLQLLQREIQVQASRNRPHRASDFTLFRHFMHKLDTCFQQEKEVQFYTRSLRVTPKRLAAACRGSLGKTPQAIIIERVMIEAKRRLLHSAVSIQQLGFDLGYEDPSHFTKAFRTVTGETPTAYRKARVRFEINFSNPGVDIP